MPIDEIDGSSREYAPYFGRGFVQLTWKDNYQKYSTLLGRDFVKNPDQVKEPVVSAFICVHGMKTGTFTGASLGQFISDSKKDYVGARTIVNGYDRAEYIAELAKEWEKKIDPYLTNSPIKPVIDNGSSLPEKVNTGSQITESSIKGTEIIVELGFGFESRLISYHFLHTETESSRDGTDVTTFKGQSIRWTLSRVPLTTSYESVTLKQITEMFTSAYGLKLDMKTEGVKYHFLDQSSLTPFQLLQREYKKIGYRVTDKGSRLIVEPEATPKFSNYIITKENLIKIKFTDKARGSKPIPYQAISDPYTSTNDQKFAINPTTGKVTQILPQSLKGVPKADSDSNPGLTTGNTTSAVSGIKEITLDPNLKTIDLPESNDPNSGTTTKNEKVLVTKDDGSVEEKNVTTTIEKSPGKIVTTKKVSIGNTTEETKVTKEIVFEENDPKSQKTTTVKPDSTTIVKTSSKIDKDLLATLESKVSAISDNYGLPKQTPGSILLENGGKIEAQVISDEAKRIRGYECYVTLRTSMEELKLLPGEILGISGDLFPDPFDREWRIYLVAHNWAEGVTDLVIYTPQGLQEDANVQSSNGASTTQGDASSISDSDFRSPMPKAGNSVAGLNQEFGYGRGRLHTGIDLGGHGAGNDPDAVYAAHNGKVLFTATDPGEGYGNYLDLKKPDGWSTRYAHLAKILVREGDAVTIGQKIGIRGNSGTKDIHLHFELRNPQGSPVDPRSKIPNLPDQA